MRLRMKTNFSRSGLVLLLLGLAGSASERSKPPAAFPQGPMRNLAPERPPTRLERVHRAATEPVKPVAGTGWRKLFDGATLKGWREPGFAGAGQVQCTNGLILCWMGEPFTGVNYTND